MGTIKESILADLDRTKISETTLLDFRSPTIMDKDVVCSQIDQDEFKAFVEEQGENDLNMSVRLIDYIMAKELYKSVRTGAWGVTAFDGATIQETVTRTIHARNTILARHSPKGAWEMLLNDLRRHSTAHGYTEEMEALIQSLGDMVSMDIWDQVWRLFLANPSVNIYNTSVVMSTNLLHFIDAKDSKEAGNQAILVSLADWINEWMMDSILKN